MKFTKNKFQLYHSLTLALILSSTFISKEIFSTSKTEKESELLGEAVKIAAFTALGQYAPAGAKAAQVLTGNYGKTQAAIDVVKYVFNLNKDTSLNLPPIPPDVEAEIAKHVIHTLKTSTPEKMVELSDKYRIEKISSLTIEQVKEKLVSDASFRREVAERIGCVIYQNFRMFGWKSAADTNIYELAQCLIERNHLDRMPPMFEPFAYHVNNLKIALGNILFDKNYNIKLCDNTLDELSAQYVSVNFLQQIFPNTWVMILEQVNMEGFTGALTHADIIADNLQKTPEWITRIHDSLFGSNNILKRIAEKKQHNIDLINQKFPSKEKLQKVKDLQKKQAQKIALQKENFLKAREEFAKQFDLHNHKDKNIQALFDKLTANKNDLNKGINLLTDKKAKLLVCTDKEKTGRIVYEKLFDKNGVYKLIPKKDDFIDKIGIPQDIGLKKNILVRRQLNQLAHLRYLNMGETSNKDSAFVEITEKGLLTIPAALAAKGKNIKIFRETLDSLCQAIKDENIKRANAALKKLNNIINPKKNSHRKNN